MSPLLRRLRTAVTPLLREHVLMAPRRLTADRRRLPDFILLGAMKAGTTSLYHALAQHPQVQPACVKGIHFFDNRTPLGERWYRAHFPHEDERAADGARGLTGEASPAYLVHPRAPAAIRAMCPDAKLIAIVRDPVKRAHSHYNHNLRKGADQGRVRETLSFADALDAEEERLAGEEERLLADPAYSSVAFNMFSYKTRGRYAEQLERYAALFPPEQILVVQSEAFYRDVQATLARVFDFLGLAPWRVPDTGARNAYEYRAEPLDAATRDRLAAYFAPHNRRLYDRVGEDYGWLGG